MQCPRCKTKIAPSNNQIYKCPTCEQSVFIPTPIKVVSHYYEKIYSKLQNDLIKRLFWLFIALMQIVLLKMAIIDTLSLCIFTLLYVFILLAFTFAIHIKLDDIEKLKDKIPISYSVGNQNHKKEKNLIKRFLSECLIACKKFYSFKSLSKKEMPLRLLHASCSFYSITMFCFFVYQFGYFTNKLFNAKEITQSSEFLFLSENAILSLIIGFAVIEELLPYTQSGFLNKNK